jgi:catalase (peroxidase I)
LTLTAPEMTVLVGGMRVLKTNSGGATQGIRDRGFFDPLRGLLSGLQAQQED